MGPRLGARKVGAEGQEGLGGSNFRAFFFLLPPAFSFFFSLAVFPWNFGGVLVGWDLACAFFRPQAVVWKPPAACIQGGRKSEILGGPAEGGPVVPGKIGHAMSAKPRWVGKVGQKSARPDQNRPKLAKLKVVLGQSRPGQSSSWPTKLVMARFPDWVWKRFPGRFGGGFPVGLEEVSRSVWRRFPVGLEEVSRSVWRSCDQHPMPSLGSLFANWDNTKKSSLISPSADLKSIPFKECEHIWSDPIWRLPVPIWEPFHSQTCDIEEL